MAFLADFQDRNLIFLYRFRIPISIDGKDFVFILAIVYLLLKLVIWMPIDHFFVLRYSCMLSSLLLYFYSTFVAMGLVIARFHLETAVKKMLLTHFYNQCSYFTT